MDNADGTLFGATNEQADWQAQTGDNTCAEMSAADIIQQATPDHLHLTESEIVSEAGQVITTDPTTGQSIPVYDPGGTVDPITGQVDPGGTDIHSVPNLLAQYGVSSHFSEATPGQTPDQRLSDLEQTLAGGQSVIASVDAQEIWNAIPGVGAQADPGQHDHELVVTGIDTQTGQVYLNDSGVPTGAEEHVDLNTFMDAWSKSNYGMVSTDAASATTVSDPVSLPSFGADIQSQLHSLQNAEEHSLNPLDSIPVLPIAFGGAAAAGAAFVVREVVSQRNRAAAGDEPVSAELDSPVGQPEV